MNQNKQRVALSLCAAVVLVVVAGLVSVNQSPRQSSAAPAKRQPAKKSKVDFTADGKMIRPTGYRRWIYTGTPLTPHDMNNGKAAFPEFHSVYIDPDSFDNYEKTGEFPDGTVFVKELVSVGTKEATSGNGYFMGDFTGLEVLMKDKTRFNTTPSFGPQKDQQSQSKMLTHTDGVFRASSNQTHLRSASFVRWPARPSRPIVATRPDKSRRQG